MKKNNTYSVKYNLVIDNNKVIEDDSYEFDTKKEAKQFSNTQVDKLTCLGLYKVYKQSKNYVILNSHDKQYSTKIEIVKNIKS